MITRTRCLVTVATCVVGLCVSLSALNGAATAATKAPGVNGIWLAYAWSTGASKPSSPDQVFLLHNTPGSARVTGTLAEFKILGTFSPATGKATLVVGVQPGTTRTTNYYVKFVFKSNSTAQSNHPTFSGSFDYVSRATGEPVPDSTGKVEARRCSYQTNAKAQALCGFD
jgi:hypothetical protein